MRKRLVLSTGLLTALFSAKVASAAYVGTPPPAGTEIGNVATAIYYDENNNKYVSTSNLVKTIVKAVYGVAVQAQVSQVEGSPGQLVYIPFTVKNLANTDDTINLSAISSDSNTVSIVNIYWDKNSNGVLDPGEPQVNSVSATLGQNIPIIVVAKVQPNASSGNSATITLTATSNGDSNKSDSDSVTLTVQNDAVIQISMAVDKDVVQPGDTLTYTINFANVGNKAAFADAVNIDGNTKTGILVFAQVPQNTTFKNVVNKTPTGGTVVYSTDGSNWTTTEPTDKTTIKYVGYFIPDDNPDDNNYNAVLDPDQQGSFVFAVDVVNNPTNNLIEDNATVKYKLSNGSPKTATSNTVVTTIPATATAAVDISDGTTKNNVPAGSWVEFTHTVTNSGKNPDTINIAVDTTQLPPGSIVEIWNSAGNAKLIDTDGDGLPDVGKIPAGESANIKVKIYLPADTNPDNAPYTLTIKAISGINPQKTDTTTDTIQSVIGADVDIAKFGKAADGDGTNDDILLTDNGTNGVKNQVNPGESAYFPVEVANTGGSMDSYALTVSGLDVNGAVATIYGDKNKNGQIDSDESVITKTPLLGGSTLKQAANQNANTITVYNVAGFSAGDTIIIGAGTTNAETATIQSVDPQTNTITLESALTKNHNAGEKVSEVFYAVVRVDIPPEASAVDDETFDITATSKNANTSDSLTAHLKINEVYDVSITPDNNGQLPPGGTLTYAHTVVNTSNTNAKIVISIPATTNLSYTILDENKEPQGTTYTIPNIGKGQAKTFYIKVIAPSDVDPGTVEALPVKATVYDTNNQEKASDIATDTTTIIEGYLQLTKSALDENCQNEITQVNPGGTICYWIRYKNIGTKDALNVEITDPIPQYTTYVNNSACIDSNCDKQCDSNPTGSASYDSSNKVVIFHVGTGADNTRGGTVKPGENGCVLFKVKVDG